MEVTKHLGLTDITPIILSDAGNFIVHLAPYSIVARIAKLIGENDSNFQLNKMSCELKVVKHLISRGIQVVPYSTIVSSGPHQVSDTWMTLWEYIAPFSLTTLSGECIIDMINELTNAMADFHEYLPTLGVWRNVSGAAERLRSLMSSDKRIEGLLIQFEQLDKILKNSDTLYPAHGDAHPGNLIASSTGWRWIDFEDASLMPKFWDMASYIGNTALFYGLKHPVVDYVLTHNKIARDKSSFQLALKARVIMATTTNLALALSGNGDLEFAYSQLAHVNDFIAIINKGL